MKLLKGMNVWSLPKNLTLREQFQLVKEAGFDTIELNVSEINSQPTLVSEELALSDVPYLTLDSTSNEIGRLLDLSKEFALPISSLSTSLHWTYPLSSSDTLKREKGITIVKKMLQFAAQLECDTILVVPGLVTKTEAYDECYSRASQALKELAPLAEMKEVTIGLENVWNKFLLSPLEMRTLIDTIGSPYVGAYFDVGNILQYGFPEQWIQILGHRIAKIHVKDFNQSIGNIQGFTSLLAGDIDWAAVISALTAINYNGPLTCELSPYKQFGEQLTFDSSQALNHIISLQKKEIGGTNND
ncbi:L-ribulose-5-phosphate 3-epimerase [Enterococcus sp. AZ194]|uniref:sugar phosphate isomerase/epimerase family protein n=1 Tax=Enterococcus sp. AZ194 TaxID=2774629 RepID=UPI003F1E7E09